MDESTPQPEKKLTPQQELKDKLRLIRQQYKAAEKLLKDINDTHDRFIKLRDTLINKEDGIRATVAESANQKKTLRDAVRDAGLKLVELDTTATSIKSQVDEITATHGNFTALKAKVFSETDGFEALHIAAKDFHKKISDFADQSSSDATNAGLQLTAIVNTSEKVETAYAEFLKQKAKVNDPETGLEAQLAKATEYADEALQAKVKAESELASVIKLKDDGEKLISQINSSRTEAELAAQRSKTLTDDIRDTLNKASGYSLSRALADRTLKLQKQLWIWGLFQFIAIILLIIGVGVIFYSLFIHGAHSFEEVTNRLKDMNLISVVSKALFTTPLVFAVYFTTSNFRHIRDLRDQYAWKETVAKNFQNYIKLMKDEFSADKYEEGRFEFAKRTIESIYKEPHSQPKKRKYNFGFKVVNVQIEEEDLIQLEQKIEDDVKEIVENKIKATTESIPKRVLGRSTSKKNTNSKSGE